MTLRLSIAPFCAALVCAAQAHAQGFTLSAEAGTERAAEDFSKALLNYDIVSVTRNFDNGMSWTAQLQNYRAAKSGAVTWAVEGLVGYRSRLTPVFSLYGNLGLGARWSPTRDFPFFTLRAGADDVLGGGFTWNVVNLRWRTGWDRRFPYHSTTAGTGLSYQLNESFGLYGRVFAAFDTDYRFAGTGLGLGVRAFF